MATVVQTPRATNNGMVSTRAKVSMGDLYHLDTEDGGLYVVANEIDSGPVADQWQCKWHTKELRPKFTTISGSAASGATSLVVDDGTYVQVGDLIKITRTKEVLMITALTASSGAITVTRTWGSTAAAVINDDDEVLIIGPHYGENATLRDARSVTEVQYTNQLAIWRHNLELSETHRMIGENGGHYHEPDLVTERKEMMKTHKRDINLACINSELGDDGGTQRSIMGFIEFVNTYGTNRVNSTSAVTYNVFVTAMRTATKHGGKKMLFIVGRLGAEIVSQWGQASGVTVNLDPGAKLFGLQIMDVITPHGRVRFLVDETLDGDYLGRYWLGVNITKKNGPKWRYLRNTVIKKNRQDPDQDGYEEEIVTEGTMELGNPDHHYLFDNAQTAS